MSEVRLKVKVNGYFPISINPEAFDIPPKEIGIKQVGKEWTVEIHFSKDPKKLKGNIINCDIDYLVTELYLPNSVKEITASLGWLVIENLKLMSINKSLLSKDKTMIIQKDKVLRQIGNLESYVIPEGVTTIGESAFERPIIPGILIISRLEKVEFPSSVTVIEKCAFKNQSSLPLKFPRNLQKIGDYAFEFCGGDKASKLSIPSKVTSIGRFAFKKCTSITGVKIGKNVTEIGDGAFAACDRIKSFEGTGTEYGEKFLVLDKRLISVAVDSSFMNYDEVVIPDNIEEIGDWAITYENADRQWQTLKKLPSNLRRIGERALYGVRVEEPVEIPETVEEISEGAFSPKMRLRGKYVTEDGAVIKDGIFLFQNFTSTVTTKLGGNYSEHIPEYKVPDGVKKIGNYANLFVGKIILPEGLETIGEQALTVSQEIKIPSTLKVCYGIHCWEGCASIEFPEGISFIGDSLSAKVPQITLKSDPPIFTKWGGGGGLLVVPEDKFIEYKEAYTGIIDERNYPNGRIAYINSEGELCYEK